jgi:serine/threonine-protein kinase
VADSLSIALQSALGDAYRVERELSPGGMSRIFLATESSLGRAVVIKVLPAELANEVSATRFRREIEIAARLQHPHILPVLTAGVSGSLLYFIMPYVPGESLRHRLARERQLPMADALRVLREIADALAYAHANGVVHRDVKPENILLESGHAVLADFGIARALLQASTEGSLTATGLGIGTPGYMAPEQAAGERSVDARADVYALAVVGYEMIAGMPPFSGPSAQAVMAPISRRNHARCASCDRTFRRTSRPRSNGEWQSFRTSDSRPPPSFAMPWGVHPRTRHAVGDGSLRVPPWAWLPLPSRA